MLDRRYGRHRLGVDRTVQSSTRFATESTDSSERMRRQTRRGALLALCLGVLVVLALFLLIRGQLARGQLARGELAEPLPAAVLDSTADSLEQMRVRLEALLAESRRSAAEALEAAGEIRARALREAHANEENARIQFELDRANSSMHAAEATSRAKGDFLSTMSHEPRTPMNGVLGFTQLLLGTELSAERRAYVQTVDASGQSLLALVNKPWTTRRSRRACYPWRWRTSILCAWSRK